MDTAISPFHADELAIQQRLGVREQMVEANPYVRDHMPEQHRQFYAELPFFFLGATDASGQPWATMLAGGAGFIASPDARTLDIAGGLLAGDPLEGQLRVGGFVGGLGLAPTTRRRNRVNGVIASVDEGVTRIAVSQSFGNCPQYIQHRQHSAAPDATSRKVKVVRGTALSAADRELIARADTFFIASANLDEDVGVGRGVDMSHRGGRPGFVRIDDDRTLTSPEFVGNFFFNTMGNLLRHPRAGLLFIDFERGDMLHVAVEGEIIWEGPQVKAFAGAERLLRFHIREVVRNVGALPFRWTAPQPAVQNARTGNWDEADRVLAAAGLRSAWRPFTVKDVVQESDGVRSFYLEPGDGMGVAAHLPGQFISVRAPAGAGAGPAGAGGGSAEAEAGPASAGGGAAGAGAGPASAGGGAAGAETGPAGAGMGPSGSGALSAAGGDGGVGDAARLLVRSYTLSDAPDGRRYRISVKRDGAVSGWLHDHLVPGATLELMGPGGDFTFEEGTQRPVVMLSAGIGITPMIAMLNGLLVNGSRTRHKHAIHFIHGARSRGEHAFDEHLRAMAAGHRNLNVHVRYSGGDVPDSDIVNWQASAGRIDMDLLKALLPFDDYDFYLCGPAEFMQQMYDGLRKLNVADARIRFEAFGPASVRRSVKAAAATAEQGPATAVAVRFAASGVSATWNGESSLLALAEANGVSAPSGCRSGMCGACAVGLEAGAVRYTRECAAQPEAGQVLMCSAVPQAGAGAVTLAI
ncbi:2Fe-2S iron-sulfur cluster-binding protein [Duganella aceris]|uniref:2Fe-2S iron-sulfur cluster binding domain-containing protein n=1 Tax=Duganella aceris TaxID=2703883 RepID=A0ABX0FM66_9BURK|nr:pyridoxamine 5'-phosphate oxidase family protein [Duganella aceris]NGZ85668.1 2Fe-2S iron-sulfur cluster binding domain-containing protein [Duganella aceris]